MRFSILLYHCISISSYDTAFRWIQLDHTGNGATLVQVLAWWRRATSHYLSQCLPTSISHMASLCHNEWRSYFLWLPLQWRHNGRESVSNHQPYDCLLNRIFRRRKLQSSASLAFVRGIHRGQVNSPHKWPVTRKMFPFDDVIMSRLGEIWGICFCWQRSAKPALTLRHGYVMTSVEIYEI